MEFRDLRSRLHMSIRGVLVGVRASGVAMGRKVPILGGLADCKGTDHAGAAREIFAGLLFSTVTFWLSAGLIFFQGKTSGGGFLQTVAESFAPTFNNGELFVFAVSFVGPIVYIAFDEPSWAKREFPQKLWHAMALFVLALACGALFAAVKTGATLDMALVITASVWLAVVSVALRYLATVFNKARSRPAEEMREQTADFIEEFEKHRGGDNA